MKIHIIGGSGTGKSFISEAISKRCGIPHYDLDDIFWDNEANAYGTKMPPEIRTKKLNAILESDRWIIEGVFYGWLQDSFASADKIFILETSPIVCNFRIVRRYIKRKLGVEKGKKETFHSLLELLAWTSNYQKARIPEILEFLHPYKHKVVTVKKPQEIWKHINRT